MFKRKIKRYLHAVYSIIGLSFCIALPVYSSDVFIAAGYYNNYPYEYLNSDGKPSGFSVEIFKLIIEKAGIDTELLLLPPERMAEIIIKGEPDIIIGGIDSAVYREYLFAGTVIEIPFAFAASADSLISDSRDFRGKRVAVTGHEIFSESVSDIIRKFYHADTLYINNPDTAMLLLSSKGCDAVCIESVKMNEIIKKFAGGSIHELDVNPGRFRYGFYVRKDNQKLFKLMMTGLSEVNSSREYGEIYSMWFKSGDKGFLWNKNFLIAWFLISAAVFIFFIFINSHILSRRINEKTANLTGAIDLLKKTESVLNLNEKRYRKIFNNLPSGILILDSSGKVVLYNEAIIKIFGIINPDEILNLNVIESPNFSEWFKARIKKYHSVSVEYRYDFDVIRRTGFYKTWKEGEIIIDACFFPFVLNSVEEDAGYICHILDVTQNRNLLHEKNETARRYGVIFDSIRDGLWEWSLLDDSLKINRQFANLLGYHKDRIPETFSDVCKLIHPGERDEICDIIRTKISCGRSFTVEYSILKNDGEWLRIRSRGDVVEWNHELSPVTVVATHTDITPLTRTEKSDKDVFFMVKENERSGTEHKQVKSFDGRKALIVDDNCLITFHLSDFLTRLGFICVNAKSGLEAVEIIKKDNEIDVVLLDIEMPELDGVTAMKIMKDIKTDIPVIANTGFCDLICADKLLSSGFDDVVSKPVHEPLLLEKITKLLGTSNSISGN